LAAPIPDEVADVLANFVALTAAALNDARLYRDAERATALRDEFLSVAAHELRTPITALRAILENLVDGVEPPDPGTLKTMHAQVERLGRLVDQLLDLSRLESGAVPLERRAFEVASLLEQAAEESRVHAERGLERRIRLTVDVEPTDLRVYGDPERVHQVIANLLENAVRHSPEDGQVSVMARDGGGAVRVEVADQGPGIPDRDAERVFERFYRADAARSSRDGGTGLGLAIARWIVELHGGAIHVEGNQPCGCRMVVTLPRGTQ
jgi:signal transduction histidine kinase